MSNKPGLVSSLDTKLIAIPESRQLDILANLFLRRGAQVLRVPLISILDAPDSGAILSWLRAFIDKPPDYLIILTGEGIRRLHQLAQRNGLSQDFHAALSRVSKISRGPKPVKALREMELVAEFMGAAPTTSGIIETLDSLELSGKAVAVQLYGEEPNLLLTDYLRNRQALISTVAPYIYAPDSDSDKVVALLHELMAGKIDVICFTSQPQFKRLLQVSAKAGLQAELFQGLAQTVVAAIGPIVSEQLESYNVRVDIMPTDSFFMKPLVTSIERHFNGQE